MFLPGAGGSAGFWEPVAGRLPASCDRALLGWPGAGDEPHEPGVESFEDLIELAASRLSGLSDLVAQSLGGVVAVGLAMRYPEKVRRLVLVATSGGIGVDVLGAGGWRAEYRAEFPTAAAWVTEQTVDHTAQLPRVSGRRCCCGAIGGRERCAALAEARGYRHGMTISIRPLEPTDRPDWERLFRAYIDFYERILEPDAYDRAWARLERGNF